MPFQKGQSGNPGGRVKRKPISDMYVRILAQNPEKLRRFCETQIDLAIEGDVQAAKEITDRVEGKALQSVELNDNRTLNGAERLREIFEGAMANHIGESGTGRTQ